MLLDLEVADDDADELRRHRRHARPQGRDGRGAPTRSSRLPGGLGTLEELLEIWVSRTLGMHAKPVVVLDPDGVFDPLRAQVDLLVEGGFVREGAQAAVSLGRATPARPSTPSTPRWPRPRASRC